MDVLFQGRRIDNGQLVSGGVLHQTDYYGLSVDKWFIVDGADTEDNDIGPAYRVAPESIVCIRCDIRKRAIRELASRTHNIWRCSNCKCPIGCSNYCPNCGAKMDCGYETWKENTKASSNSSASPLE